MTQRPSTIRELCAEAGCTTPETDVMALLADGHHVNEAAAQLRLSPSKTWALRRSAKRRIREQFGITPDDDTYETGVKERKKQIKQMHGRGHSDRFIADRLGINYSSVNRSIGDDRLEEASIRVEERSGYANLRRPADADEVEPFHGGASRKSLNHLDHWASSTGIDPFLEPGTSGGPPVNPVTYRRVGDDE